MVLARGMQCVCVCMCVYCVCIVCVRAPCSAPTCLRRYSTAPAPRWRRSLRATRGCTLRGPASAPSSHACATFTAASPSRATITPLLLVTVPSDRVMDVDARAPARRGTGTFDAAAVVQVVAKISAVPFLQPHTMDGAEDGCERSTKWYVVSGRRSSTRSGGAAAVWTKKMVGVGAEVSVRRREMEYKSVDGTRSHPIVTQWRCIEVMPWRWRRGRG